MRSNKEIRKQIGDDKNFLVSAITKELHNLAYLEYFDTWENNGGMGWFFSYCTRLTDEVMFKKDSPYLRWLEHWKVTPDNDVIDFLTFTNETCFDWYHMNEARKIFIDSYTKDECTKQQFSEVIGGMINKFDSESDKKELISMAITYANDQKEQKEIKAVMQLLKNMNANEETILKISKGLNLKITHY
mgnify:CR=1 FL=1|tara:strand:- start:1495 stop:2058 length:564 start_codon:yes stop_codon:yes gene_type:complete